MMQGRDAPRIMLWRLIGLIFESQAIYLCSSGRKTFTNYYITQMFKYITELSKLPLKHHS